MVHGLYRPGNRIRRSEVPASAAYRGPEVATPMTKKTWDFDPEPALQAKRDRARQEARSADMHVVLTDQEEFAQTHEALRECAKLLVEASDDFLDRALEEQEREEGPGDHILAMEAEREHHLERICQILVREAVKSRMLRRA